MTGPSADGTQTLAEVNSIKISCDNIQDVDLYSFLTSKGDYGMMQCCGKLMGEDNYCRVCGGIGTFVWKNVSRRNTKTVYSCSCGAIIIPGDVFCGNCGKSMQHRKE